MPTRSPETFAAALARVRVVPVLTIEDGCDAVGLARALVAGGLDVLEITLRTPAAVAALGEIARALPGALVGAVTVLTPEQAETVLRHGARFIISPGMTPRLIAAANDWRVPFLPGAVTASEAMALADLGYRLLKFFPAEPAGGIAALKALAAPLPMIRFCPTGGIDAARAPGYLGLANVIAVGGSWVAPRELVRARDWVAITKLAAAASGL